MGRRGKPIRGDQPSRDFQVYHGSCFGITIVGDVQADGDSIPFSQDQPSLAGGPQRYGTDHRQIFTASGSECLHIQSTILRCIGGFKTLKKLVLLGIEVSSS